MLFVGKMGQKLRRQLVACKHARKNQNLLKKNEEILMNIPKNIALDTFPNLCFKLQIHESIDRGHLGTIYAKKVKGFKLFHNLC